MKTELSFTDTINLVAAWSHEMNGKREELIRLDQIVGDGDLGITMQKAFSAAEQITPDQTRGIGFYLVQCGMAMAKAAPSTMGTLMATGFMRGGKALPDNLNAVTLQNLATFFSAFTSGIAERGKARAGDKTVLDVLLPASVALEREAKIGSTLKDAMKSAKDAAFMGLESTRSMFPRHGKAAVFADSSSGKEDPGGTVALILFNVLYSFIAQ